MAKLIIEKTDLSAAIKSGNVEILKKISEELQKLHKTFDGSLPAGTYMAIKDYSAIVNNWARKIFEDQSTCEVIDGNIEETVPWQVGMIKAYCSLLLENDLI